jgi:hypothetical protein
MIQVKVRLARAESVTSETAWIALHQQMLGNPEFGEPDPIIVGTGLIELYETGLGSLGLFGEPDPIIVGTGWMAFYAKGLESLGPLAEPDPIIVGNVLMTLNEQEGALGEVEGMALFALADEEGGEVVVSGKRYGIRFLWRLGSFWVGRDSLTIVVSK